MIISIEICWNSGSITMICIGVIINTNHCNYCNDHHYTVKYTNLE